MVYQSYPIRVLEPPIKHLALSVPFFILVDKKVSYVFCNKQFHFEKKHSFEKGRYKLCLKLDKQGEPVVDIEKIGEFIPEKYKL